MRKIFLLLSIFIFSISRGTPQNVENSTKQYFKSETYNICQKIWKQYKKSYDNKLASVLHGSYGHQSRNVYIKRAEDELLLSKGYYHSDNQVQIVFQNILLEQFPYLTNPRISFDICANVLSLESTLSRMIIHADYFLFRNMSDIIYLLKEQNSTKSSPFLFEQVKNNGQLAITAENCFLSGSLFTMLDNGRVYIGIDMMKLQRCQFSIDVYTPGQKTPAVVANYLFAPDEPFERNILLQALCKEITPTLQSIMNTHVNTYEIFGKDVLRIEQQQKNLSIIVGSHISDMVGQFNNKLLKDQTETIKLPDFTVEWTDGFNGNEKDYGFSLSDITLSGIDSAYSSHIGGPFQIIPKSNRIAERVKWSHVEVLGTITRRGMHDGEFNFAADIYDAEVDIILDVNKLEDKANNVTNYDNHNVTVRGWRTLEFSCPRVEELPIEAIVTGYIRNELPSHVGQLLVDFFTEPIQDIDNDVNDTLSSESDNPGQTDNQGEITGKKNVGSKISETNKKHKLLGDIQSKDNRGQQSISQRNELHVIIG